MTRVALSGTQTYLSWGRRDRRLAIIIVYAVFSHFNGVSSSCILSALAIMLISFKIIFPI